MRNSDGAILQINITDKHYKCENLDSVQLLKGFNLLYFFQILKDMSLRLLLNHQMQEAQYGNFL